MQTKPEEQTGRVQCSICEQAQSLQIAGQENGPMAPGFCPVAWGQSTVEFFRTYSTLQERQNRPYLLVTQTDRCARELPRKCFELHSVADQRRSALSKEQEARQQRMSNMRDSCHDLSRTELHNIPRSLQYCNRCTNGDQVDRARGVRLIASWQKQIIAGKNRLLCGVFLNGNGGRTCRFMSSACERS